MPAMPKSSLLMQNYDNDLKVDRFLAKYFGFLKENH